MFQRTKLCTSLLAAFGSGVLAMAPAFAQNATPDATVQRVEITGSAIRRIDAESALPVVVLKKEDIAKTGATSTVDLLQRLSTVQGGTQEANSVGGSTFGFSGVSVHDIGETRTLVLLNGHRLSLFGGQTLTGFAAGFDLNAIPISAIERVEVLTDGASALYGADAIAGVVNFITKSDTTAGDITAGFSNPKDGAKETRVSFSKGFGSLETDGWNAIFSFGHDNRSKLKGADRSFARTGNLVFQKDGKTYRSQAYSYSSIPANVVDDNGNVINPYLIANGSCPTFTFRVTDGSDDFCGFDYVSTLEIYPERTRDSALGSFKLRVGEHDLFADILMSSTSQTSRIAPVPGALSMPADSQYYQQYLAPLGLTQDTIAYYRVYDLGLRTDKDKADFMDIALGSKGVLAGWDYQATYTHSESNVRSNISGYPGALALGRLRASGLLNPFVLPGQQTPEAQAALNATAYNGYWDGGVAKLDTTQVQFSNEIAKMPAGPLMLAAGGNYNSEKFTNKPGLFAQGKLADPVAGTLCDEANGIPCDQRFGDAAAEVAYSAGRQSYGAFGELNIPIVKGLEASTAIRYDHFSDFGSATTGKASFRFTPVKSLLIRGSIGTGYHAPSVPQVAASPQSYGVTAGQHTCTDELAQIAASLGAECRPGNAQYDQVAAGNKDLKPERSKQATLGFRLEPAPAFSFGLDWWYVGIRDAFGQLSESTVFKNPLLYPGSWTTQKDVGTGVTYIAWNAGNLNLGKAYYEGLDLDVTGRANLGFAKLSSQVTATRYLRQRYQQEIGGEYFTDMGDNSNGAVVYRWKGAWRNTLSHGPFSHTLAVNFRSGYYDAVTEVEVVDPATGQATGTENVQLHIKPYFTFDWQSSWDIGKSFNLTAGLLNLTNRKPPFVLNGTGGQQAGYDANLYDPRGRTLYLNGTIKF